MNKISTDILKTKQHFEVLDGLRGIAAIAVVVFHFMEMWISDYSKNFIAHGFLAVDFFFCLSGFVIGYAYDDRIKEMGVKEFFKSRMIRLHPLVILGSILGLLTFLFDPFGTYQEAYGIGRVLLIFLCSIFLIPFPTMTERSFNNFSFNAPAWSLFWEYIANIFYVLILCRISRRVLFVLTIISGGMLFYVCNRSGNISGGWGGDNFWDGSIRIAYSFMAGLFVYRSNWIIKNKLGFIGMSVLLSLAFIMPYNDSWNWLTESIVVLFYFPFLIAMGAGSVPAQGIKRLCSFSGKISYPLYMTHYTVIWVFLNYYKSNHPSTTQTTIIIATGTTLLIGIAYLTMVGYDIPIRKYLTSKRERIFNQAEK